MIVTGLDIAAKTGVAQIAEGVVAYAETVEFKKGKEDRFARWSKYGSVIASLCAQSDLVVIENYGFSFKGSGIPLVEQGAIIRLAIYRQGIPFIEVPPLTLKKFVSGNGGAKKKDMLLALRERWKFETNDDNIGDAYGLAMIGVTLLDQRTPDELAALREKYDTLLTNALR